MRSPITRRPNAENWDELSVLHTSSFLIAFHIRIWVINGYCADLIVTFTCNLLVNYYMCLHKWFYTTVFSRVIVTCSSRIRYILVEPLFYRVTNNVFINLINYKQTARLMKSSHHRLWTSVTPMILQTRCKPLKAHSVLL